MEDYYDVTSRRSREYLRNLPMRSKKSLDSLYPRASPAAIDFLNRTLTCKHELRFVLKLKESERILAS